MSALQFTIDELQDYLFEIFPQSMHMGRITQMDEDHVEMTLDLNKSHLRPGDTVSGPVMMALADVAMYAAILSKIGRVPLAVTTNLNINFMRKPEVDIPMVAKASIMKLGKSLVIGEVSIYSGHLVAHATLTYSVPKDRSLGT